MDREKTQNGFGNRTVTRREALKQAVCILKQNGADPDIIKTLAEIENELPFCQWTKESILDAIRDYSYRHGGILPHTKELVKENRLPSNTVIENLFGYSSVSRFYDVFFPDMARKNKTSSPYENTDSNILLDIFKENYSAIKEEQGLKYVPYSVYYKARKQGSPVPETIMKRFGCDTYRDLLLLCGFLKKPEALTVSVSVTDSGEDPEHLKDFIKDVLKQDRK